MTRIFILDAINDKNFFQQKRLKLKPFDTENCMLFSRMRQMTIPDIKGSFLNEESQLSSQSDSLNLSQELMRPNFNITADANIIPQQAKPQKMDSGSDLIHFSAITEKDGGTITPDEKYIVLF